MKKFESAVESALQSNSIETMKKVCFACVDSENFQLAQICGLHIIVHPNQLRDVIDYYQNNCYHEEIIMLLAEAISSESAHNGIYTELAILYCKYKPQKVRKYLEIAWSFVDTIQILSIIESKHLWPELLFLYDKNEDYDNCVLTMINHPLEAWEENYFKAVIAKVSDEELYYSAVSFYLAHKPSLLNEILLVIPGLNHERIVTLLKAAKCLHLVKPYLQSVQKLNRKDINESMIELLITESDHQGLEASIKVFDQFDHITLAQKLEKHSLPEFQKIAAYLYKG